MEIKITERRNPERYAQFGGEIIRAEIHDDAWTIQRAFSATAYFASLSDRGLYDFLTNASDNSYETDAIAEELDGIPGVRHVLENRPDAQANQDTNGYEVNYSRPDLEAWTKKNRPTVAELYQLYRQGEEELADSRAEQLSEQRRPLPSKRVLSASITCDPSDEARIREVLVEAGFDPTQIKLREVQDFGDQPSDLPLDIE